MRCILIAPPYGRWISEDDEYEECWRRISVGDYSYVYVATPPSVTGELLLRLAESQVRLVIAEKPWFKDLETASRILPILQRSKPVFRFVDHYLHRPAMRWALAQNLPMLLGGLPREFVGRLFEATEPASPAMSIGVLHDTLIHMVTIVRRFCPGCPIQVRNVQVKRYQGAPSPSETFVRLHAVIEAERPVDVILTAAKAHRVQRDSKAIIIRGPAATLHIDLDREAVHLVTPGHCRHLYSQDDDPDAYLYLLRQLDAEDKSLGLDAHEALEVLRTLNDIRGHFPPSIPVYDRGSNSREGYEGLASEPR